MPHVADAGTKFWKNNLSGSWNTASNWSATSSSSSDNGGVPVAGDTVNIVTTDTGSTRTITYNYTGTAIALSSLAIDQTGGSTFDVLSMAGNALTVSGNEQIGISNTGHGSMSQTGGVNTVGGKLSLGVGSGSTGTYALSNGAYLLVQGGEIIGDLGAGTFTQSGSTSAFNEPNNFLLLNNASSLYTLSSGFLYVTGTGSTQAEILNAGTFNQTGGNNSMGSAPINYSLQIGAAAGQSATYNLSSGLCYVSGSGYVGGTTSSAGGTGNLNVNGGTLTITGALKMWNTAGTLVNFSSGAISVGSLDTSSTPGLFSWTGGALSITGASGFGLGSPSATRPLGTALALTSSRTLNVTNALTIDPVAGANFTLTSGTLTAGSIVNNNGSAGFTWTAGTINITGNSGVTLGGNAPFGSSVTVDSSHMLNVTNALTIPVGTALNLGTSGSLTVGSIANNGGTFNWGGGTLAVTGASGVTLGGAAPFGSSVTVDSTHPLTVTNKLTIPTGTTLNLQSGGTLTVGAISYPGSFNWSSATLAITGPGTNLTTLDLGTNTGQTLNQTGGSVATGNLTIGTIASHTGTLTLNGAGVAFTDSGSAYVGGTSSGAGGTGTLNVQTGSTMTIAGALKIYNNAGSIVNLSGGSLSADSLDTSNTTAGFNWTSGTLNITGAAGLGLGNPSLPARPLGTTLSVNSTHTLSVTNALTIDSGATLTLTTGTLTAGSIINNGTFTWTGGSGSNINITGAAGVTLGGAAPFGTTLTADANHVLSVTNALTIPAGSTLNLTAGILSAGSIVDNGTLTWTTGTFAGTASGAFPLASATVPSMGSYILSPLNANMTVTAPGGTLTNNSGQFILTSPNGPYDVTFAGNITNAAGALRVRGGSGGARVVNGTIDNQSGALIVFNSSDGVTLTVNELTMEAGSQFWPQLGPPGFSTVINVTDKVGLTLPPSGLAAIDLQSAANTASGVGYSVGTYPLFHYNVALNGSGTDANLFISNPSSAFSYSFQTDSAGRTIYVDIVPKIGESWNGSSDANWITSANWSGAAAPTNAQLATFPTPIPSGGSTITVGSGQVSNGMLFNDSYTLTGGSLALANGLVDVVTGKTVTIATSLNSVSTYGSLGVLKTGLGTLVLNGSNTYTGTTVADTGTLKAGANNTFPAVGTLQASGGTIDTNGTNQTVNTVILSAGNINVNSGTLTVTNGVMVNAASGAGHINLGGGTLSTPSYQANANKTSLNWTGGTLQLTGTGAVPVTTVPSGTTLSLNPTSSNVIITGQSLGTSGPAKPAVIPIPIATPAFNSTRNGAAIDTIVIHTTEESYAATIGGFESGTDAANYVNNTDGTITEVVDPATGHAAFHATYYNDRAIGIENVGFADQAGTWNPQNIASLEKLVAYLAYTYNVPVLRPTDNLQSNVLQVQPPTAATFNEPGIMAHGQIQPNDRYDPGFYFPWTQFIGDVQTLIANSIAAAPLTNNGTINVTNPGGFGVTYRGDINNVGALNVTNTNFTMSGNITTSGTITQTGGLMNLAGNLVVSGAGSVKLTAGSAAILRTQQVTVNSGKVDLADGKMIVTGQSVGSWNGSNYTGVTGLIRAGRNGGAWNGSGIVTSQTAALAASGLTTLAVAANADLGKSTFGGQSVGSSDVLVMYTYAGDADLSGRINGDDYFRIDSGFAAHATGYDNGDFNLDGKIDADDYFIIDRNYSRRGSPFAASEPLSLNGVQAVPEPACALMLTTVGVGLVRRRRVRA